MHWQSRLKNIVGAIDCTHIKITKPRGILHTEQYRNRKGYFSLNVQVVGGPNLTIHDIVSRWQHWSTLAANKTRAVTICRWVIEAVNGIFKEQFKLFCQEFFNRASAHLMIDFSIAAVLINKCYIQYTDRTDASQIVEVIHQKMFLNNTLADFVNNNNYNRRRAHFISINVDSNNVTDFPLLSYEDLILIACGTYQLKQARSYYGEHIRFDGSYTVEVCREAHLSNLREELSLSENTWLLRGKIQSRHVSRKIYYVYILINPNDNGREAILQYCCNCIVGRRTVGCCAHIMTIIWYLGWARYQSNIEPPAQFLDNLLIKYDNLIATKAAQVGIKSYELYESSTGYFWQMLVYSGKKEHNLETSGDQREPEGATSNIINLHKGVVSPLLNKGHTLVMDNFYNSPLLARTLKTQKTDVMGTIRLNREFVPDSLRSKNKSNMRTGEVAFSQTRDLTISAWKDANVVTLISTYHPVEVSGKEKYGYSKYKPKVVLDYNLSMGGVDKKDQLLQAFPIERVRNINWYKKLFRRLLNVSIHNAFVMFPKPSLMAQRQFRVLLADEIIQRFRPPKVQQPLPTRHFPAKTNKRKSRCKWCRLKNKDSCTSFKCCTCDVNLCIIGCFEDYHVAQGITE
uniref:SFRICE_032285 n=1 Tax=Spodoptera frugiperda TaxID=7108 RepID=A0A2H1WRG1_SPOFR